MLRVNDIQKKFKENGYDSVTSFPLIYKTREKMGVSFTLEHEDYGSIERVQLFESLDELDEFLKKYKWYKTNGKINNVTLLLTEYNKPTTSTIYTYKGSEIDLDIMKNLEDYDLKIKQDLETDDTKRIKYEIEQLFKYLKFIKDNIYNYIDIVNNALNDLYEGYKKIQVLIDIYNKEKINRDFNQINLKFIKFEYDIDTENKIKEEFSQLNSKEEKYEEYEKLLNKLWSFLLDIELNDTYMDCMEIKNNTKNEQGILDLKINYLEKIIQKTNFFNDAINLKKKFKRLEKKHKEVTLPETYEIDYRLRIIDKYKRFKDINIFNLYNYLTDTYEDYDYEKIAIKYKERVEIKNEVKPSFENILENINNQYSKLPSDKQEMLILFDFFFEIINKIISVDNYQIINSQELLNKLESEEFEELMNLYYKRLSSILFYNEDEKIISLMAYINFDSEEKFVNSLKDIINQVLEIKMIIPENLKTYFKINNYSNYHHKIERTYFKIDDILTDTRMDYIVNEILANNNILYCPQKLVLPPIEESIIRIKDNNNLIILEDRSIFSKSESLTEVGNYQGEVVREAGYSYVEKINELGTFNFYNMQTKSK